MEETPNQNTTQNTTTRVVEQKSNKSIIAIILALLTICGVGFGVYEFIQNNNLQTKNNELQNTIKNYELSSSSKEDEEKPEIESDIAADNYLEIPEWGIKIKIPNTLKYVKYKIAGEAITIWATESSQNSIPDFANPDINQYGMGYIYNTIKSEHDKCQVECGMEVFSFDDRLITYATPQAGFYLIGQNSSYELSCNIICDWLRDSSNYSNL